MQGDLGKHQTSKYATIQTFTRISNSPPVDAFCVRVSHPLLAGGELDVWVEVGVSIKIMSHVWDLQTESLTQKLILLALADNSNDSGVCWPSISTICKKCQCGERTVQENLKRLEKLGWLKINYRFGHSSVYTVATPAPAAPRAKCTVRPANGAPPPPRQPHPEPSVEPSLNPKGENPPRLNGKRQKFPSEAQKALLIIEGKLTKLKDFGQRGPDGKLTGPDASEWKRLKELQRENERIACAV